MVNTRVPVGAPTKQPLTYGLFSVAEMRRNADRKWQMGVTWQNTCPDASTTYDSCLLGGSFGVPVTGVASPSAKSATADRSTWGATPFTVVVEVDCSPPGFWDQADEIVERVITQSAEQTVERVFWTGTVNGTPNLQFPHLAAGGSLTDNSNFENQILQLATANVGPTGGAPLDVVEAMGKLESALSACVKGVGVIHVPSELIAHLKANHLLEERDGVYYSPAGHKIAVSSGYLGSAPTGISTDGVKWMYATGPVFVYASNGRFIGDKAASLNRTVDTLKRIYEQTFVVGYDCCLFGVAVSTGGVITGAINSAT